MGVCESLLAEALAPPGLSREEEAARAAADAVEEVEAEEEDEVISRTQQIEQVFRLVLGLPRTKRPFDPNNPRAHLEEPTEELPDGPELVEAERPPEPLMPAGYEEDQGLEDSQEEADEEWSDSGEEDSAGEEEAEDSEMDETEQAKLRNPVVARPEELEDVIELCGNKEVWEDIDEMREDEDAMSILGKAGEHSSSYPWAKAHFVRACRETSKLGGAAGEDGALDDPYCTGDGPPLEDYIGGCLRLRTGLSHIQRANIRLRVNMSKDLAALYFDENGHGADRIGLEVWKLENKEKAEEQLTQMSKYGLASMRKRVEERLNTEILPSYYAAYDSVGDKEALAYPEEVLTMEYFYPPDPNQSSDDESHCQLDVTIHQAKNVIGQDVSFSGESMSDCYVKATVGDETFTTDVRKQTRNPVWEKSFKFDVDPEERMKMNLVLKVFDEDIGSDEFLGECKVELKELVKDGPPIGKWHTLTGETDRRGRLIQRSDREKAIDRGMIFVTLRFGEPTEGDIGKMEDNLSCVPLAQVEGYHLTRIQINHCATLIQAVFRGYISRFGAEDWRNRKTAEQLAVERRVLKIQRTWRDRRMWRKIQMFKGAMTKGMLFVKVSRAGKMAKRLVHCPGDMKLIYWKDPEASGMELGKSMPVSSIKAIVVGRATRAFQRCDKTQIEKAPHLPIDRKLQRLSFSLVASDRTLDLMVTECKKDGKLDYDKSETLKNEWIDLFQFLLRDQLNPASFALVGKSKKFDCMYRPPNSDKLA